MKKTAKRHWLAHGERPSRRRRDWNPGLAEDFQE